MSNHNANTIAAKAIRALLDGHPPDGIGPPDWGLWAPVLLALVEAWQQAGTAGVRAAFDALRRQEPALAELLAGNQSPVKVHEAGDAWLPRPRAPAVVQGLIDQGAVVLLFGTPGVGKTWIFTDLAVCVASGAPWLGMATAATPVLIVDEESGARRLFDRLERTMTGHGVPRAARLPIYFTSLEGFDLRAGKPWLELLEKLVVERGAGLVVVDALADVMMGGDENAVQDTQPVFHGLRTVAENTGAAVVVVHHANKTGRYRGSSAIPGAVDLVLGVSACNDDDPQALRLETVKARDVAPSAFGCRAVWDARTNGFRLEPASATNGCATVTSRPKEYVLRFLASRGGKGADMATIMANADTCSPESAKRAVYDLTRDELIRRIDGRGGGSKGTWAMAPRDRQGFSNHEDAKTRSSEAI